VFAPWRQLEPLLRTYQEGRRIEPAAIIDIFAGRPAGRGAQVGVGQQGGNAHATRDRRSICPFAT